MIDDLDLPTRPLSPTADATLTGVVRYAADRWAVNTTSTFVVADGTGLAHHETCYHLSNSNDSTPGIIWGLTDDVISRLWIEERDKLRLTGVSRLSFCVHCACGGLTAREAETDRLAAARERVAEEQLTPGQRIIRDTRLAAAEQRRADRMR